MANRILVLFCFFSLLVLPDVWLSATEQLVDAPLPRSSSFVTVLFEDPFGFEEHYREFLVSMVMSEYPDDPSDSDWQAQLKANIGATELFSNVFVETRENDDKSIQLLIHVIRRSMIHEINISGNFPVLKQDVLAAMTVRPGMPFDQRTIQRQQNLIEQYLERDGFVQPFVTVVPVEKMPGLFDIEVSLLTNRTYYLSKLSIIGAQGFSEAYWQNKFRGGITNFFLPAQMIRFNENTLEKKIKRFQKLLWKKGYCQATISIEQIEKNQETGAVNLRIGLKEGAKYVLDIKGNKEFFNWQIKNKFIIFREGDSRGRGIKKSIENIKEMYLKKGYARVKIDVDAKFIQNKDGDAIKNVSLTIFEGQKWTLKSIEFAENHRVASKTLKDIVNIEEGELYRRDKIENSVQLLKEIYIKDGYANIKIKPQLSFQESEHTAGITFIITEGKRFIYGPIHINGIPSSISDEMIPVPPFEEGTPFRFVPLNTYKQTLRATISELGYPHVSVELERQLLESNEISVTYTVDPGPFTYVGKIFFIGNYQTKPRVVVKELGMKEGDIFSLKKVWKADQSVRNIEIFRSTAFLLPGIEERANPIPILISISEKSPYFAEIGAGFETDVGYRSTLRIGNRNLFGFNKKLDFQSILSQTGELFEMSVRDPRIFWTKTSAVLSYGFERDRQDAAYDLKETSLTLGFFRTLSKRLSISLNNKYLNKEITSKDILTTSPKIDFEEDSELRPRDVFSITPGLLWQNKDSLFRPRRGFFLNPSVTFSRSINGTIDNFIKVNLTGMIYRTPIEWCTIASVLRLGKAYFYDQTETLPTDEKYYLGGTNDVRGFRNDELLFTTINGKHRALGGNSSLSGSVELRFVPFDFYPELEIPLFLDFGYIGDNYFTMDVNNLRESMGVGLRYHTPIGPISILYARPIDRKAGELTERYHFSIGYSF